MSEYFFGITHNKPTAAIAKRRDRVARKHGGAYVEVNRREGSALGINHGRYQSWYAIPNRGNPFDAQIAAEIRAELGE